MSVVEILDPPAERQTRGRWPGASLLALTVLGAATGFLVTTLMQPTYTAGARLMVTGGADPTVPIHIRVETERALVETPQVIARVIATERLNADREFGHAQATEWDRQVAAWGLSAWLGRAPIGHDVPSRLIDAITVERLGDAALFDIRVTSRDPNKAARLSNALVDAYLTERADLAMTPANAVDPEELARLGKAVRDAEIALQGVRQHLGVPDGTDESAQTRITKARERLTDADARAKRLEAAVRAGVPGMFDQDIEGGALRDLRRDHAEATRRQADLLREYGPKHYRIIEVSREIDRLREQGLAEARRVLDRARSEIARERETIRTLEREVPTTATSGAHPEEAALQRAFNEARQAYETAKARARGASSSAGLLEPVATRILSRATPPLIADQVSGTSVVGGGALIGLILGLLISLLGRSRHAAAPVAATIQPATANDDQAVTAASEPGGAAHIYEPTSLAPLVGRLTGRDVILSLGDGAPCHRAALALARAAASHGRVVLIEVDGAEETGQLGLGDVLEGAARFTEVLHADSASPLHRMPPGRRAAARYHRFSLVVDALGATYDRVIIALGELPDAPELIATLDDADRVIVATDATPVTGAEAEAIAALEAVISLGKGELHVVGAPPASPVAAPRDRADTRTGPWRSAG